ncbi:MAG: hypothetical protein GY869_23190, partial [Planctomycetes bacterium]|nr:hypothetical protein [Planctomycetota bacterium]
MKIGILAIVLATASWFTFSASVSAQTDCAVQSDIPQAECNALVDLYNSTDGPNWTDAATNNWNQDNSPCGWTGVLCSGGSVTRINRGSNNLTGAIPDLSDLINLELLHLDNNQLTGAIPDLSALTNLEHLNLYNNQRTAPVPDLSSTTQKRI